ncbi:PAS domain S-box protein, partial [bacterium]|nr:PAS domain S-box protein [bacterium]
MPNVGHLGEIPIARMSPFTGALFFLAGLAVLALVLRQSRTHGRGTHLGHWGGSLGSLTVGIGLLFCLAYLYGSPLFYGQGATVPMALTTALAFLMLGGATIGVSGENAIPMSLLAAAKRAGKSISERGRFLVLAFIMFAVCAVGMAIMTVMLYRHDFAKHREQLQTATQGQSRLIEAIARYDAGVADTLRDVDPGHDSGAATLSQIIDAHEHYKGFGETGEFTLARRDGDSIVFVLRHRHGAIEQPAPVAFDSDLAEPMRRALQGLSGTVIGLDYRGKMVLAAYEPVAVLNLGIVAKIDLAEIRAPFIRSGLTAAAMAFLVVLAGTALFFRIANPIIARLEAHARDLEKEVEERRRAEETLREKVRLSQILLDGFPCVALLLRPGTREIVASNRAAARVGAVPGKTCFGTWGQFDTPCPWCLAPKVWSTGESQHLEPEGLGRVWDAHWIPVSDDLCFHYAFDITERKQTEKALRESEEQFRRGIMDAPVPIMIHAEDGEVIRVNNVWTELTGYTHDDIPTIADWMLKAYGERMDDVPDVIDSLFEHNEVLHEGEFTIRVKSGQTRTWDFSSSPLGQLPDGRRLVISMATDSTKRKQSEEEREKLITKLESQNTELERFTYTVSHDLKSPLITIGGYVGLLREDLAEGEPGSIDNDLSRISGAADKMARLLDDVLELSRIGRLANSPEDVALEELAHEVLEIVGGQIKKKGVQVEILPGLPVVFGDRLRLSEVLQNLIDNGVKYM